mmetsp:Transcript_84337/g.273023  ORF Transcript_84337/g.273023 Transcript_84337/m.273023 type:complete len:555 (+) Transcript_84337:473-2137(+)
MPSDVRQEGHCQLLRAICVRDGGDDLAHQPAVEVVAHSHGLHAGNEGGHARQTQRRAQQADGLIDVAAAETHADENSVGPGLRPHTLAEHLLEGAQGPCGLAVGDAGLHQVRVHVHVREEAMPLRDVVDEGESAVELPRAVHELHEEGEREVARGDALLLHLVHQTEPLVHKVGLGAAVEQRVVHDLVRLLVDVLLHLLDDFEGFLNVTHLAVALQHGAVGDQVPLDAMPVHVIQKLGEAVHAAAACASVNHRVVRHDGEVNAPLQHLLVHGPDPVQFLLPREALQHRAVDHRVQRRLALLVLVHLIDELIRSLRVAVVDNRLHHAAQGDAGGPDVPAPHGLPTAPDAIDVPGVAVGLDKAAERVGATDGDGVAALELLQLGGEEVQLADADAGLHDRGEQDLVDRLLHLVDQRHGLLDVILAGVGVELLQEDRARNLVRVHSQLLHLPDDFPDLCTLGLRALGDHPVDQLVERHVVRLEALLLHLRNEHPSLAEVPAEEVRLDQRVVGDHVREASLLRLLHPGLSRLQVLALDASLQHRVVDHAVQLQTALLQ